MKRTRISEWPAVRVNVNPSTLDRIEQSAESRALSVAALIREAIAEKYDERPRTLSELKAL